MDRAVDPECQAAEPVGHAPRVQPHDRQPGAGHRQPVEAVGLDTAQGAAGGGIEGTGDKQVTAETTLRV